MAATELTFKTVAELSGLLRRRKISAVELLEAFLTRIGGLNPHLNAFITVTREHAVQRARLADREIAGGRYRGPLHGVPYAVKDVFATKGIATTNGSKATAAWVPSFESAVTERLNTGGAILVGKLNLWEFAHIGWAFGVVRNPWHVDYSPGGSSSGSGAAVAARMVPLAIGTDTGGSIRVPAAHCGIVGLRPTYGRVSRYGVTPNAWSVDTAGPMATTVEDVAIALRTIAGADERDRASTPALVPDYTRAIGQNIRGVRVGVPDEHFFDGAPTEVERAVLGAIGVLAKSGARVVELRLPHARHAALARSLHLAEAVSYHEKRLRDERHLLGRELRERLEAGRSLLASDYIKALRLRSVLMEEAARSFEQCDVLAVPTDRGLPPRLENDVLAGGPVPEPRAAGGGANTFFASMTGIPALAIPCGFSQGPAGLPISLMLHARPFDEFMLFRVGHFYQSVTDWHRRRPAL